MPHFWLLFSVKNLLKIFPFTMSHAKLYVPVEWLYGHRCELLGHTTQKAKVQFNDFSGPKFRNGGFMHFCGNTCRVFGFCFRSKICLKIFGCTMSHAELHVPMEWLCDRCAVVELCQLQPSFNLFPQTLQLWSWRSKLWSWSPGSFNPASTLF